MIDVPVRDLRAGLQALCPGLIHELVPGCRREGKVFGRAESHTGGRTFALVVQDLE